MATTFCKFLINFWLEVSFFCSFVSFKSILIYEITFFQLKTFEFNRERMENLRQTLPKLDLKKLPNINQAVLWKKICLVERNSLIPISPEQLGHFACHKGTPPTTRFVLSLNDVQIDCLLKYLLMVSNF